MFQSSDLSYSYHNGPSIHYPNLEVEEGKNCLIIGRSGSGKTTLLNILAGFLQPKQGKVTLDGSDLYQMSESARDLFRAKHIGFVFQKSLFVPSLTIGENLMLCQGFAGYSKDKSLVNELLERLDLSNKYNVLPQRLSIGEQQRASIARALLNRPAILLADEPTSALDDDNAEAVLSLLRQNAEELGTSLIIVTHDHRIKAQFSHLYELKGGEV